MDTEIKIGKVKQTEKELEDKIKEIVDSNNGGADNTVVSSNIDILWELPINQLGLRFEAQKVSLTKPISNYRFYSIGFHAYKASMAGVTLSTGLIRSTRNTCLLNYELQTGMSVRNVKVESDGNLSFQECKLYSNMKTNSTDKDLELTDNRVNTPLYVLGYK